MSVALTSTVFVSLGWGETLLRLGVASLLGGLIGLEREMGEKDAGVRTCMLVATGSALFTLVSAYGFSSLLAEDGDVYRSDPSRIAAQIVAGIGFLGAGVILRRGSVIRGLTTGASLWLVAGVGMAAGAGFWPAATLATAAGIVVLRPLSWLKFLLRTRPASRLEVELDDGIGSGSVVDSAEALGDVDFIRRDGRLVVIRMRLDERGQSQLLERIFALDGVTAARWTH
jgi:putative Mg2+ transporter-C (MgtC) family protein